MAELDRMYTRKRRRGWRFWLSVAPTALIACQLLAMVGAFSPLISPWVYPHLAPTGWHNITPHGNIVLNGFAASATTPGLMVACATSMSVDVRDPSTWNFGGYRFWLSRDGGASWNRLRPPTIKGDLCAVSLAPDGSIAVSMSTYSTSTYQTTSTTTWVSHDAGRTWQPPAPKPTVQVDGQAAPVTLLLRRHGTLYGTYASHTAGGATALAASADNGRTWQAFGTTPDAVLERGWWVQDTLVPDYRDDRAWYRVLYANDKVPVLEHSSDDGQTWREVGPIGSGETGAAYVNVNPAQPDHLCADFAHAETDRLTLFSSSDGGLTWREGAMPQAYSHTNGETTFGPAMDADGGCYQGYHFGRGEPPGEGSNGSQGVLMRLPANASTLQALPLTRAGEKGGFLSEDLAYVPAGNGMPGRLVIGVNIQYRSWPALFSELAGEMTSQQIIWTAVP